MRLLLTNYLSAFVMASVDDGKFFTPADEFSSGKQKIVCLTELFGVIILIFCRLSLIENSGDYLTCSDHTVCINS